MERLGVAAFEKLVGLIKVVEASAIKQPCRKSNFENTTKRYAGDDGGIKGL